MRFILETYEKEWRPGRLLETLHCDWPFWLLNPRTNERVEIEPDQIALIVDIDVCTDSIVAKAVATLLIGGQIYTINMDDGSQGIPMRGLTK